jgi:hypothetical protein
MANETQVPVERLVDGIDLPHKRQDGWTWVQTGGAPANKPGFSRDRLMFYAGKLRELGMSDTDIAGLLEDLYWDAYIECSGNDTFSKAKPSRNMTGLGRM